MTEEQKKTFDELKADIDALKKLAEKAAAHRAAAQRFEYVLTHLKELTMEQKVELFNALVLELACR